MPIFQINKPLSGETQLLLQSLASSHRFCWNVEELPKMGEVDGPQLFGLRDWGKQGEFFCGIPKDLDLNEAYFESQSDDATLEEDDEDLSIRDKFAREHANSPYKDLLVRARMSGGTPHDQPKYYPRWTIQSPTEFEIEDFKWLLYLIKRVFAPHNYLLEGSLVTRKDRPVHVFRNCFWEVPSVTSPLATAALKDLERVHADFWSDPTTMELFKECLRNRNTTLVCDDTPALLSRFRNAVAFLQFEDGIREDSDEAVFFSDAWQKDEKILLLYAREAANYLIKGKEVTSIRDHLFNTNSQSVGARILALLQPSSKKRSLTTPIVVSKKPKNGKK